MPNYANGKIYKIWSLSTDEIYIGSTVEPLSKRMTKHRHCYKKYKEGKKLLTTSSKIFEHGDAKIELIEKCPCSCREELVAREGYYIRTMDCVNKIIPDRTRKQHYQDNKDKMKQYRQANREKRLQQMKQYRQANKEAILKREKEYRRQNKEKIQQHMKQYRRQNKEKIQQYNKQYRQANKKKLKLGMQKKITCECGVSLTRGCLARHKKTKKHLLIMNTLN